MDMRRKVVVSHSSTLALFKGTRFAKNKVAKSFYRAVDWSSLHTKSNLNLYCI